MNELIYTHIYYVMCEMNYKEINNKFCAGSAFYALNYYKLSNSKLNNIQIRVQ